ncbi:hypothetical protein PAXINDRAFT_109793, partial [Paxillus involutus ATCC 200175]
MQRDQVESVLEVLQFTNTSATQFLLSLLTLEQYNNHPIVLDLLSNARELLSTFDKHPSSQCKNSSESIAAEIVMAGYRQEVCSLSAEENGLHFNVSHTSLSRLESFSVKDMAKTMCACAPQLWKLLDVLLAARTSQTQLGKGGGQATMDNDDDEDAYWLELGEDELDGLNLGGVGSASMSEEKKAARRKKVLLVKKIVIISILTQSTNRKSNALQSIVGIFLQSTHTPQKVIEMLARMGISVSVDGINAAVRSLSAESHRAIQSLGRTLL